MKCNSVGGLLAYSAICFEFLLENVAKIQVFRWINDFTRMDRITNECITENFGMTTIEY